MASKDGEKMKGSKNKDEKESSLSKKQQSEPSALGALGHGLTGIAVAPAHKVSVIMNLALFTIGHTISQNN